MGIGILQTPASEQEVRAIMLEGSEHGKIRIMMGTVGAPGGRPEVERGREGVKTGVV